MPDCWNCGSPVGDEDVCSHCGVRLGGGRKDQGNAGTFASVIASRNAGTTGGGSAGESIKFIQHLSDPKTQKGAKTIKGMLQEIPYVGGILQALPGLASVLEPFAMILKPFEPILTIIGALLTSLMAGIIKPLFTALKPLFDMLMRQMPIFTKLGEIFGKIILVLINALMPVILALEPLFPIIAKAIGLLVVLGLIPLVLAIYAVGIAIAALIDLFTFGSAGAMRTWNDMMLPAIGSTLAAVPEIMALQTGGYVPPRPGGTLAIIGEGGEGEYVMTESQLEAMVTAQTQTNKYLKEIYKDKAWRHRLE